MVFQSFLVFPDLDSFESVGQIFYSMFLSLGLSDVFLMMRLVVGLRAENHREEMPFSSQSDGVT